jgi:hypothetical protein
MGITSGGKGLGEVGGVDVKTIRITADLLPPEGQREGDGALGG